MGALSWLMNLDFAASSWVESLALWSRLCNRMLKRSRIADSTISYSRIEQQTAAAAGLDEAAILPPRIMNASASHSEIIEGRVDPII